MILHYSDQHIGLHTEHKYWHTSDNRTSESVDFIIYLIKAAVLNVVHNVVLIQHLEKQKDNRETFGFTSMRI